MQLPSETDTQHAERVKETFWFPKTGIAFAGFPETLLCAPPEGETSCAAGALSLAQDCD